MPLLYKIEFKDPHLLVVRLEEKNSKRILYLDTLKALAQEADREAVALLTKIHLRSPNASRNAETLAFNCIEVAALQSYEAMRAMAKTGRLLFQGKELRLAEGAPAKIYWRGEKHSEKSATIYAVFEVQGKEIPFEQCAKIFPGTPFWLIADGAIVAVQTAAAWKWIELFARGPVLLEGAQKKKFLEEELPVLWKEKAAESPLEVFPELRLQDATGCFANLWMDYPGVGQVAFEDFAPAIQGRARLKEEEARFEKDLLEAGFLRKIVGQSRYYVPSEKMGEALLLLLEVGWKIKDAQGRAMRKQTGMEVRVREEEGAVAVRGQALFGEEEASIRALSEALKKGKMWVELQGGSVGFLDRKKVLGFEGEWDGEVLRLPKEQAGTLVPLLEASASQVPLLEASASPGIHWEESVKRLVEGLKGEALNESALPSPSFQATLFPYQQKGVDWLAFLHRSRLSGLLADEMGLGKTVQVLAFFSRLVEMERTNLPILIVAPTSLLFNWKAEIARFLPEAQVYLHAGAGRLQKAAELQKLSWIVTSYAVLRLDRELFSQLECEAVALDESNAIKTAATQTAQAAFELKARFKVALSGTPIENRPEEIWSQFRFLMPKLFGDKASFQGLAAETVRRKLRPFMLRRRKEEVQLDLPEKIEQIVWIEMSEGQKRIYDAYREGLKSGLLRKIEREGLEAHRMEALEAILRLRQICCDPRLIGEEADGAKLEHLLGELEELAAANRKALIYSQFTSMLRRIETGLRQKGIDPLYLDGSTLAEQRGERVKEFQENGNALFFLLSLKAGGVGLNLTAADTAILFDPWWNEAVERQAIDRAHRIGQKKTVVAKRYLIPGTIEEKMLRLKEKKLQIADRLLDPGAEGDLAGWSAEDLYQLLTS